MEFLFKNAVEIAKKICLMKVEEGDIIVDATMGNGNDTAFLCSLVGETGKVYAFDVQETALNNTRKCLLEAQYQQRAQLILDGHENMDRYVTAKVKLILFNLGYLPKGNHAITTKKETTLKAVEKSLDALEESGVLLLVLYPGHLSGREEKEALEYFTSNLNQKRYTVTKHSFLNQINNPPELICIEKNR
ncbi:class I SAM-dependent methyltransferase [Sinanaerobacter sp. ZZT-01]|uniref:tRNA (mnm(5)s(2)U34)-methyltransferase n=1 Tax=Sinanaerobacter sp. ZZT-01 TaxID=3111540 RepID=UPI002D791FC3|nr:class I SAM-dependent methyltransferase [Sinanaerobacter sp. ZZT-01]WRR93648.1 class I SAM-dependent methyltransferase [Sinanaerobacter sp. ZZT-01]